MKPNTDERSEFWELVNARLDERADPLARDGGTGEGTPEMGVVEEGVAEEGVPALLLQDPEALSDVLKLLDTLEVIGHLPLPRRSTPLPRILLAAAALLFVGLGAWALLASESAQLEPEHPTTDGPAFVSTDLDTNATVHHLLITVETERPDRRTTITFDGEQRSRTVEQLLPSEPTAIPALATLQITRTLEQ